MRIKFILKYYFTRMWRCKSQFAYLWLFVWLSSHFEQIFTVQFNFLVCDIRPIFWQFSFSDVICDVIGCCEKLLWRSPKSIPIGNDLNIGWHGNSGFKPALIFDNNHLALYSQCPSFSPQSDTLTDDRPPNSLSNKFLRICSSAITLQFIKINKS